MEIYKDIKSFEGLYQVSNLGNVKSFDREVPLKKTKIIIKGRIMKGTADKNNYLTIGFSKNKKISRYKIHRLVALAFIPNPENKPQVNHINGIKNDNRVENLEWCTNQENTDHAFKFKLRNNKYCEGEKSHYSKLTEKQVLEIRELYKKGGYTHQSISKIYNVTSSSITNILNKKTWKHLIN